MKKLFLLLSAITIVSCTPNQDVVLNAEEVNTLSQLDGDLLSFKDEDSFIKEYSILSEMKSSQEIQDWISKKGHNSYYYVDEAFESLKDSIIDNNRITYSDALKAIANSDSKFKIGSDVLWLNDRVLYLLNNENSAKNSTQLKLEKSNLTMYGKINSFSNSDSVLESNQMNRYVLPNENAVKTFIQYGGYDKRYIIDIFNETIILNNTISSSKMFLKSIMQYKSCSFWRCTYKDDNSTSRRLELNIQLGGTGWNRTIGNNIVYLGGFTGSYTVLLASANAGSVYNTPGKFSISGNVKTYGFRGYTWDQVVSWY